MIEVTEIMPLCSRSIFRESDRCQHLDFFFFLPNDLSHIRFILMPLNTSLAYLLEFRDLARV